VPQTPESLETLIQDVKTIKAILQTEEAPYPRVWILAWTAASLLSVLALVQYFVPVFRTLDVDHLILFLWLPAIVVCLPLGLAFLYREIGTRGKQFLSQSKVRHLLFARFVVPPAALVLFWTASRNTAFSLEGTFLLLGSMWLTVVEQLVPNDFRIVPLAYLALGLLELGFDFRGPETTLFNTLLVAATLGFGGFLFRRRDRPRWGGQ